MTEAQLEARQNRRMAAQDRFLGFYSIRERAAEVLVGEICRNGVTMFYINERGRDGHLTGKTRNFSREYDAISFLIRNHYV